MYRKSFLSPLLQNESSDFIDIFAREYIYGDIRSDDTSGTNETERMKKKMTELYQWSNQLPPSWLGAHKCSDLILYAGKKNVFEALIFSKHTFQKPIQEKPFNVINLGWVKSDKINRMITIRMIFI